MQVNTVFQSVFSSATTFNVALSTFMLCEMVGLVLGILIAVLYMYQTKYTKSFVVTLAILPAVVSVVIMMVNGNVGAGVAVAGAFSLVRFRSAPGTAKEIGAIFLAMSAGLAIGMGYLGFATVFVLLVSGVSVLLSMSRFGEIRATTKTLQITLPEHLDYTEVFDDLFAEYTRSAHLQRVKTTNMGSLLKLTYEIDLYTLAQEKQFIDALRCRNGNLEIVLAKQMEQGTEL